MSVSFPILDSGDINVEIPPVPSFVTLSLTNICQQRCRFCFFNLKRQGIILLKFLLKLLNG
ncbi:hypothetical protein K9U34_06810 [Lawsonia intracellularis]|uniref:hypothetical protein n=1 Tax=Lawsonia intracellularis TaxID=29546 RepID=UPI0005A17A2D|nr:hypothetical protein [Lawsonia intracellularis]KAA0204202.1 hypothetical protein C4K43_06595 [Lawsonia intracellularis]MBZ3893301.1 hypothetical protein [Lawsonia intracellularis]OMQ01893.1 hypothetical protein BW722_06685 [Lawsonia intracellularis]RBN31855.1 hypothetical protein DR194_07005 [Lawsonia intracellularis]RBN32627.1 hypothetical protein DR192_07010 [Lawsonia intracellularis]